MSGKLIFIILISAILRFYKLGLIPEGAGLSEAKLGIFLTKLTGFAINDLLLLRLPFVVLGVLTIYLFYKLTFKLFKNENLSLISAFLLSITPWHIIESRTFSWGLISAFLLLLIFNSYPSFIFKNFLKLCKIFFLTAIVCFLLSLFSFRSELAGEVDYQRNIAAQKMNPLLTKVFSNKLVQNYRYKEGLVFENLDPGNYFFIGYPRQRWGKEDIPKLYFVLLPFAIAGLFKIKNPPLVVITLSFLGLVVLISAFGLEDNRWGLPAAFVFSLLSAYGILKFYKKGIYKAILIFSLIILFLEMIYFSRGYYGGVLESQFSQRRKVYAELANSLTDISSQEEIVVTKLLDKPEIYLKFHNPELSNRIRVNDLDIKNDRNALLVGVLPDEASPAELLFKKDGEYPETIEVVKEIRDEQKKQTIVIFRSKI